MANNETGSAGLSPQVRQDYRKNLLREVWPKLVYGKDAIKEKIPGHTGRIANFRRWTRLAADNSPTPITEGQLPNPLLLQNSNVPVPVDQYGAYVVLTDRLRAQSIDNVVKQTTKLLAGHMRETLDVLARNIFVQATSVRLANGKSSLANLLATDVINETDVRKLFRDLMNQNAVPFDMDGDMPYFKCIIDPAVHYDLQDTAMWKNAAYYQNKDGKGGMVKILFGIMFIPTTLTPTVAAGSGGTVPAHLCFTYGQEFGAILDIEGLDDTDLVIHLAENDNSVGNALELLSTIGWKTTFGAAILNQTFCSVYKCAASGG